MKADLPVFTESLTLICPFFSFLQRNCTLVALCNVFHHVTFQGYQVIRHEDAVGHVQ